MRTILSLFCLSPLLLAQEKIEFSQPLHAMRVDASGRLFAAGRGSLYVCAPNDRGGYARALEITLPPLRAPIRAIELRGTDVYLLTANALYLLPEGARKRANLTLKKLLWGVPAGDSGQGFRALAWGPQGDLYLVMGDALAEAGAAERWSHWTFYTQPEGTKVPYSGIGGVLRCKPDGSDLRVVARGLRDPRGLAFDRAWDLFSSDAGRGLVHITPQREFLPTAKDEAQRPKTEKWQALAFAEDGETLLIAEPKEVRRATLLPHGASFKIGETHRIENEKAACLAVAPGGRILAARQDRPELVLLTRPEGPAAPYEITEAPPDKLWRELNEPSWPRRYRAHLELTRRGGALLKEANKRLLTAKAGDLALPHLIWLAALSRQSSLHLIALIDHADARVRVQVLRALAEFPEQLLDEPVFTKFLLDTDLQVQHEAVLAFFAPKIAWSRPVQRAVERGPACSKDALLRQSAALLLARKATRTQIEALCGRDEPTLRMAGVLAAGYRLTLPPATGAFEQHMPLAKPRDPAACIFEDGKDKIDLCALGRVGRFTVAEHWKADLHTDDEYLLLRLLRKMRDDPEEAVRARAAHFLELLGI